MLDALGREVKVSLDQLKAALLKDIGQAKEAAQNNNENTEQLKKLNDNLEKIIGRDLDRELKALNKLIKKVAADVETSADYRNRIDREAKAIGKAVAKASAGGGRGVDKTMTFGKVLERSQRRFATAFGTIGKQFQKDFGSIGQVIKERINRLNPFKKFEKDGTTTISAFGVSLRNAWTSTTKFFTDNWQAMTKTVAGWEDAAIKRVSGWWNTAVTGVSKMWTSVTTVVGNAFTKTIDKIAGVWGKYIAPIFNAISKPFKKVGEYLAPIGKAIFGTVKDLFSIGKTKKGAVGGVQKDVDDMTGAATKKTMQGEGAPVGGGVRATRFAGGQSDLCRCICRCIAKLTGFTKQGLNVSKKGYKDSAQVSKTQIHLDKQENQLEREQTDLQKKSVKNSDPRDEMIRQNAAQDKIARRQAVWAQRGDNVRGGILKVKDAIQNILGAENPAKEMAKAFATATSKAAGFVASKPFEILGNILEKQQIFGTNLAGFSPLIKFAGEALGGLAEGITSLVLQPLAEEIGNFQEEAQAMYITRGATSTPGRIRPGEEGLTIPSRYQKRNLEGEDIVAKKEAEFKRTAEEISLTGQRYDKILKQNNKNYQRGIKDALQLNKVHHIGLRTASQIGSNAEETGEMFADWKIKLGASNIQLMQMERGLLSIARTTGVFGQRLIEAAKSSQKFMENMRLSGTFSAKAATNIIGLMAEAQKRGVSEGMGNLLQVLQGSLLEEGGDEKSRMLAMMGIGGSDKVRSRLMNGTIMKDRGAQKEMAENWNTQLNEMIRQRFGKNNIEELTEEEMGELTRVTKMIVGRGAEEWNQMIQAFRERGKNFVDSLKSLDDAVKNKTLTIEEADVQKQQLSFDIGAEIMDDFTKALKRTKGDFKLAFDQIIGNSEDLAPYLENIGSDVDKGATAIGDVLKKQAKVIRERAIDQGATADVERVLGSPEEFESRIKKAIETGNQKEFLTLIEQMKFIEAKTREEARQNADPATKMVTLLFKMEAHLRILMRTVLNQIAPQMQGWMNFFDVGIDKAAKEFAKGTPEGRTEAIKIIGKLMEDFPKEVSKTGQQIAGMTGPKGEKPGDFAQGFAGMMDGMFGEGSPFGIIIGKLGTIIKDNAALIEKAIKGVEDAIKSLSDNIQSIVKVLTIFGVVVSVGGVLALGIAGILALIMGGGGMLAALGLWGLAIGAATAGLVIYAEKVKADVRESSKVVDTAVDQHKKATEKRITETKDVVNRLSDDELTNKIKKANDELQRLSDISNKMAKDMAHTLDPANAPGMLPTSPAALFGVHDNMADLTQEKGNKINEAQNKLREELRMFQQESLRRMTTGKTPEEILTEASKSKEKKQSAEKQQAEIWRKFNEATGVPGGHAVNVEDAMKRIPQIAAATGKTEKEIKDLLAQFKDQWFGKSADELNIDARDALTQLISRSEPYRKLEGEQREAQRQEFSTGDVLKQSYEASKKAKKEFFMSEFGATVKDEQAKKVLENYIDRFLEVQMSAAKELKVGDIKDAGRFNAPDELKDPEKYKKWRAEMEAFQARMKELTGTAIDLNTVNKKMIEQNNKLLTTNKVAGDAATQIFKSSKDVTRPGAGKTYETTHGRMIVAKDYATAVGEAAKTNQKLVDSKKTEERLVSAGLIAKDEKGQFKRSDADFEKYAATFASKITEKQVQEFDVTRQLLAEKDPEKQAKMYDVLHKQLIENMNFDKMSWTDYEKAITQLATLEKAQQIFVQKATTPGSIFTHDVHVEKLLQGSPLIEPAVNKTSTAVPLLPNAGSNALDQMRLKTAQTAAYDEGLSGVEKNTGMTAISTRATVRVLNQIGRMLAKRKNDGDIGVEGPDYPLEAFLEENLDVQWLNARMGRKAGIEVE